MSAIQEVEEARDLVRRLEEKEARRVGRTAVARERVMQRLGISPSVYDELRRGRRKSVAGWLSSRLRAAVEKEIKREIHRLEQELEMVRLRNCSASAEQMAEAQKLLDQAKRLIGG
jgi:hypothetical protein